MPVVVIGDDNGVVEVDVDRFGIMFTWTQPQRRGLLELPDLLPHEALAIARMLIDAAEEFRYEHDGARQDTPQLHPARLSGAALRGA